MNNNNKTVYVIVEKHWRYNDEYYVDRGTYSEIKTKCFQDEQHAIAVCQQQNELARQGYHEDSAFNNDEGEDLTRDDVQFYEVIELQLT